MSDIAEAPVNTNFSVIVKSPTDFSKKATCSLHFTNLDNITIRDVKEQIKKRFPGNPDPENQRLVFHGKLLTNEELLLDVVGNNMKTLEGAVTFHIIVSKPKAQSSITYITQENTSAAVVEGLPRTKETKSMKLATDSSSLKTNKQNFAENLDIPQADTGSMSKAQVDNLPSQSSSTEALGQHSSNIQRIEESVEMNQDRQVSTEQIKANAENTNVDSKRSLSNAGKEKAPSSSKGFKSTESQSNTETAHNNTKENASQIPESPQLILPGFGVPYYLTPWGFVPAPIISAIINNEGNIISDTVGGLNMRNTGQNNQYATAFEHFEYPTGHVVQEPNLGTREVASGERARGEDAILEEVRSSQPSSTSAKRTQGTSTIREQRQQLDRPQPSQTEPQVELQDERRYDSDQGPERGRVPAPNSFYERREFQPNFNAAVPGDRNVGQENNNVGAANEIFAPGNQHVAYAVNIRLNLQWGLLLKLAFLVFVLGQDGGMKRLVFLIFGAIIIYLWQTGGADTIVRFIVDRLPMQNNMMNRGRVEEGAQARNNANRDGPAQNNDENNLNNDQNNNVGENANHVVNWMGAENPDGRPFHLLSPQVLSQLLENRIPARVNSGIIFVYSFFYGFMCSLFPFWRPEPVIEPAQPNERVPHEHQD